MATKLSINGVEYEVDAAEDTPLLWVLRDSLQMTGTKFGCGIAQCGACTVHVDGAPVRICSFPIAAAAGKNITTYRGKWLRRWQGFEKSMGRPRGSAVRLLPVGTTDVGHGFVTRQFQP